MEDSGKESRTEHKRRRKGGKEREKKKGELKGDRKWQYEERKPSGGQEGEAQHVTCCMGSRSNSGHQQQVPLGVAGTSWLAHLRLGTGTFFCLASTLINLQLWFLSFISKLPCPPSSQRRNSKHKCKHSYTPYKNIGMNSNERFSPVVCVHCSI